MYVLWVFPKTFFDDGVVPDNLFISELSFQIPFFSSIVFVELSQTKVFVAKCRLRRKSVSKLEEATTTTTQAANHNIVYGRLPRFAPKLFVLFRSV